MTTFLGKKKSVAKDKLFQAICYRAGIHTSYIFHILVHGSKFKSGRVCTAVDAFT